MKFSLGIVTVMSFLISGASALGASDLITQNLAVSPTCGAAGSVVRLTGTIRNQGNMPATASMANLRLSASGTVHPTTADPLLTSISVGALAVNGTQAVDVNVTIPASTPTSTRHVWVILDVNSSAGQTPANETNDWAVVPLAVTPIPGAPHTLTAIGQTGKVLIGWTDTATNETGFKVQRRSGTNWPTISTAPARSGTGLTAYEVPSQSNGTSYDYRVVATNCAGDSGASNVASATPLATPNVTEPDPGESVSGPNVTLDWGNVSGADFYSIDMGTTEGDTSILADFGVTTSSHTLPLALGTYWWRVTAAANQPEPGLSTSSNWQSFTVVPQSGACCHSNFSCTPSVPSGSCSAPSVWMPDSSCSSCTSEPTGACCLPGFACTPAISSNACTGQGGTYAGDNMACSNCPSPPNGACCSASGSCAIVTSSGLCGTGTFFPSGVCMPNSPCLGRCCAANGSCSATTQSACASTWFGGGTCSNSAYGTVNGLPLRLPWRTDTQPTQGYKCTQGYCPDPSHRGYEVDFGLPNNTEVVAIAPGYIVHTGETPENGKFVRMQHDPVNGVVYTSWYLHLSSHEPCGSHHYGYGETIARSGNTGTVGYHLHLQVEQIDGVLVPPNCALAAYPTGRVPVRPVPMAGRNLTVPSGNTITDFVQDHFYEAVSVGGMGTPCPANFNDRDGITVQDIFDFLNAWLAQSPATDFNRDGHINTSDIFAFLNAWFLACP